MFECPTITQEAIFLKFGFGELSRTTGMFFYKGRLFSRQSWIVKLVPMLPYYATIKCKKLYPSLLHTFISPCINLSVCQPSLEFVYKSS